MEAQAQTPHHLVAVAGPRQCPECGADALELRSCAQEPDGRLRDGRLIGWHCSNSPQCRWIWTGSAEQLQRHLVNRERRVGDGTGDWRTVYEQEIRRGEPGGSGNARGSRRGPKPGDREAREEARERKYAEMIREGLGGRPLGEPDRVGVRKTAWVRLRTTETRKARLSDLADSLSITQTDLLEYAIDNLHFISAECHRQAMRGEGG